MEPRFESKPLKLIGKPDKIFASQGFPKPFEFNEDVVEVFDDMVSRSVPLYREVIDSILYWVAYHYQKDSYIYDLGCSTGTTIASICRAMPFTMKFKGIDNSQAMLGKAKEKLVGQERHTLEFICQDLQQVEIENASIAIMNYTLQFLPVKDRLELLTRIKQGLRPGGVLVLSEKVRSNVALYQDTITHMYEDYKRRAGYSQDEISRKKEALDNVLIPLTEKEQVHMLERAGFESVEVTMKWNNFTTFVAM